MNPVRSPDPAEQQSLDRSWRVRASVAISVFVLVSAVFGFWILPASQSRNEAFDPFVTMCRALGISRIGRAETARTNTAVPPVPTSQVMWTTGTLHLLRNADISQGAAEAGGICATCHGKDGIASAAIYPNLANEPAAALFKQLRDFKSDSRRDAQAVVMAAFAAMLTDQQMAEVAVYYSSRPAQARVQAVPAVHSKIERLATIGDPGRALPSCDSCHGASRSGPEETPVLLGQSISYLEQQLQAFAAGQRANDIFARMRMIARQLTPDEMSQLATYYGAKAPPS